MRGMGTMVAAVLVLCAVRMHSLDVDAAQPQGRSCVTKEVVSWLPPATHLNASVGQKLNINLEAFSKDSVCNWRRGMTTILTLNGSNSTDLPPLSESDSDEYTLSCEARNGTNSSLTVSLLVHPLQKCLTTPQLKLMIPESYGYSAEFQCVSEGYPTPAMKWFDDLNRPGDGSNGKTLHAHQRTESSVQSTDYVETTVMCCASNAKGEQCTQLYDYGNESCDFPVTSWPLFSRPQLILNLDMDVDWRDDDEAPEVNLSPGQSLLLRCRTEKKVVEETLEWQRDSKVKDNSTALCFDKIKDQICIHDDEHGGREMLYLFIESVTENHSGMYTCRNMRNYREKSVHVHIMAEDFLFVRVDDTSTISVKDTQSYCLRASVFSHPQLLHCAWESPGDQGNPGTETQCSRPTRPWKNRTLELCGQQQSGEYQLKLEAGDKRETKTVPLCVATDEPKIDLQYDKVAKTFTCETTSPLPGNLTWMSCPLSKNSCRSDSTACTEIPVTSQEDHDTPASQFCHRRLVSIQSAKLSDEDHAVRCCLTNSFGYWCTELELCGVTKSSPEYQHSESETNTNKVLKVCGFVLLLALIVVSVVLVYFVKKKRPQYQSQLQMIQMVGPNDNDYIYINFKDFQYDQKWEFPRENLELGKELGSGAFGMVVQATAYGINKPGVSQQVAVKMLKEKHQSVEKEALMSELKMLTHIGHHANIVNLLGACTGSGPTYLIFQYCCYGDLLNYLKTNRERYHKSLTDAFTKDRFSCLYHNLQPKRSSGELERPLETYVPMYPSATRGQENLALLNLNSSPMDTCEERGIYMESEEQQEELQALTYDDLLSFAYQVAKGMEFLSCKNCIHRDLAARNVLVTKSRLVKIGDFGLARDIDNDSNYVVRGNVRLPVKWMAPESIFQGMYTMQSDVWAYGILLWEIFSLGVTPYPGVKVDDKFYCMIERGFKMECPYYASESLYRMMGKCWALEPGDRPPFSKLVAFMEDQLTDVAERLYHNVDQNSNDSIYQNATATLDISALTKEKEDQTQSQNLYCMGYATEEATATVSDSEAVTSEDKPLKG